MKINGGFHRAAQLVLVFSLLLLPELSDAAVMNDYCIVPPFIQQAIPANLLLMIDNSSSMYDLEYSDQGNRSGGVITRQPVNCYDETYSSGNSYAGYFEKTSGIYYTYDPANSYFVRTDSAVTPFPAATSCTYYIANTLCVTPDSNGKVGTAGSTFAASGKYLNWLSASKFDAEKGILTGGKTVTKLCSGTDQSCNSDNDCSSGSCTAVDTRFLQAESRGCVGQPFIKTPLTSDFQNYTDSQSDPNNPANLLGITFAIRGPVDSANPSNPSRGGQTYIDVYRGSYNNQACQTAINDYYDTSVNQSTLQNAIQACINYNPSPSNKNYCSQDTSRTYVSTCTTDTDCNYTTSTGTQGTCATVGGGCWTSADCPVQSTTPGTCTNTNNSGGAISCTSNTNCAAGAIAQGKCSNNSAVCSTSADCQVQTMGKCAVKHGNSFDSCSSDTACGRYGPCNNPAPQHYPCNNPAPNPSSSGTCTNPSPVESHYSCTGAVPPGTIYLGPCVNPTQSGFVKTQIALSETIQTCWTYLSRGQAIGTGDYNRLIGGGKCDDVYAGYGVCSGNSSYGCSTDADCAANGAGTCSFTGPAAIQPGNPALICGNDYLGKYCTWNAATKTCTWDTSNPTAIETDYANFCNAQQPTVIDPTDTAASTANYEQLPALLGGVGLQGQLGISIGTIPVRVKISSGTQPMGVIQQFGNQIRIGAMSFNFNGSSTEAAAGTIAQPRVCSNNTTRLCSINADCPGGSCLSTSSSAQYNLDGGLVSYPIGLGACATMATPAQKCATNGDCTSGNICLNGFCGAQHSTVCTTDINCSSGDACISNGVGDHTTGLVNAIDSIRANAWTPFAEAFYNAIGYFARVPNTSGSTPPYTSRTNMMLNNVNSASTDYSSYAAAPKDFNPAFNPSQYKCQQNYALLITDGSSTADQNSAITSIPSWSTYSNAAYASAGYTSAPTGWNTACPNYAGSSYLPILSYIAQNRNIADFTQTPQYGRDKFSTFVVTTGGSNGLSGECNSINMLTDTAINGGTKQLYLASNPDQLSNALSSIFQQIAAQSASGTAASILSNSSGSGANILQALFFPDRRFGNTSLNWIGEMLNLWYYVDPFLNTNSVREDTGYTSGDHTLDLVNNNILSFSFDSSPQDSTYNQAVVSKYLGNADGTTGAPITTGADAIYTDANGIQHYYFSTDHLQAIWRAGAQLQATLPSARNLYTPCQGCGSANLMGVTTANDSALQSYLQAGSTSEADNIINWVRGSDATSSYRQRTVTFTYRGTTTTAPWKLGDIISSTPRTQSSNKQNTYDLSAPGGYNDGSYSAFANNATSSNPYANRGMAYVGANDGMLHAFRLGTLNVTASGTTKATLTGETSTNPLGSEQWAFIPTNSLPYLRYLTCTANGGDTYCGNQDYGHLYSVDGSTTVVDVSIGNPSGCTDSYYNCTKDFTNGTNWRTVLIGGMGIGGASKDATDTTCYEDKMGPDGTTPGTCVKTPVQGKGYSSYFALDVTNQTFDGSGNLAGIPKFMWEFSDASISDSSKKGLGFASTGAAIVRISTRDVSNKPVKNNNGRWFAVFGSGPTGPIDKTRHQFLGTSNQPLKIYVVDLNATMPWALGQNYWVIDHLADGTQLTNAFVSSMSSAPIDTDRWNTSSSGNYQDNALYFGYVQANSSSITASTTWTKGGVLRLVTGNDSTGENPDPSTWTLSPVITLNEPVSTGIAKLQDRGNQKLWLYFGTGRYYYGQDDMSNTRHLYGIKEPCYNASANTLNMLCTNYVDPTNLANQTDINNPQDVTSKGGWVINLDGPSGTSGAERSITDAVALTNGAVFFSTYKPTSDLCAMGGNSFLWAVKYDTGLLPSATSLKGQVLFQLSTGEFKQVSLSDSSTFTAAGGRKTGANWTGKPPSDPPPIVSNSNLKPLKKILHIQEK